MISKIPISELPGAKCFVLQVVFRIDTGEGCLADNLFIFFQFNPTVNIRKLKFRILLQGSFYIEWKSGLVEYSGS